MKTEISDVVGEGENLLNPKP